VRAREQQRCEEAQRSQERRGEEPREHGNEPAHAGHIGRRRLLCPRALTAQLSEVRAPLGMRHLQVDLAVLMREPEQGQRELHLVGMPRLAISVEHKRGHLRSLSEPRRRVSCGAC